MSDQSTNPFEPTGSPDTRSSDITSSDTGLSRTRSSDTGSFPSPPPPPAGIGSESTAYTAPQASSTPPPPAPMGAQSTPPPMYGGPVNAQPLPPEQEKQIGAVAHGIGAAAYVLSAGTLGFVAALIMYFMYRDRGPFVRAQVVNALNVQIMTGILSVVAWILIFTLIGAIIGIPLIIAAGIYAVVVHIIGAVKSMNGEWWKPPFTPDFIKA